MVPVLERALAAAEAAERAASLQQQDAQRMLEAVRPTAERAAREAAAAAADREEAAEQRGALIAAQSELLSFRVAAAAMEEERERAERKLASLEREIVDLEDTREGLLIMLHEEQASRCDHCKQATALM